MPQDYTPTTGLASGKKVKIPADADIADVVKAFKDYTDSLPGIDWRFPAGRNDVSINETNAEFAARFNRIPAQWDPEMGSGGATAALAANASGEGNIFDIDSPGTWLYVSAKSTDDAAATYAVPPDPDSMNTLLKTKSATTADGFTTVEIGPSAAMEANLKLGDWFVIENGMTTTQIFLPLMLWGASAPDYSVTSGMAALNPGEAALYVVTAERSGAGNGDGEILGIPLTSPVATKITKATTVPGAGGNDGDVWLVYKP